MEKIERKISKYIDTLNQEIKPKEHNSNWEEQSEVEKENLEEYQELMKTVRAVRSNKKDEEPSDDFEEMLIKKVRTHMNNNKSQNNYKKGNKQNVFEFNPRKSEGIQGNSMQTESVKENQKIRNGKKRKYSIFGAIAAVLAFIVIATSILNNNNNIVKAMETSYHNIQAYRGVIELRTITEDGQEVIQEKREVWVDKEGKYLVKELEGSLIGNTIINNGEKKWKTKLDEEEIEIYSIFPDNSRFSFELGNEIIDVKNALEINEIGEEKVGERNARKLEVTPKGGETYHLWVDKETNLPIQRQSPMQNAVQYKYTYIDIEFAEAIPEELMIYEKPEGYVEIDKSLEQLVTSKEEAVEVLGFETVTINNLSDNFKLNNITVDSTKNIFRAYFTSKKQNQEDEKNILLLQKKLDGDFKIAPTSIIGEVEGYQAEYKSSFTDDTDLGSNTLSFNRNSDISMIKWHDDEYQFAVIGEEGLEGLTNFITDVIDKEVSFSADIKDLFQPQVGIDVDLIVEENTQKSIDGGSSPWKLDPAYVASVEASLLISPEGITGEPQVQYEDIVIIYNDGIKAIAEINSNNSSGNKIYLEKLIRQDDTGIWTMVGYDINE